jgi:regulator of sigma E protease
LLVIAGIGFLIFVHELGHFLVAKLVGIRVLAFSIGFGPKLLGFRAGETEYRLSLFPLGGYVKMAGESPEDGEVIDERDFRAKTVGQRAAVISAGVVMNAIFGFLIFVVAFSIGVPFDVPEVGAVRKGGPAWEAGVPVGARILEVNGNTVYDFTDVSTETALSRRSADAVLTLQEGDGQPYDVHVQPRKNPASGIFEIGVYPPLGSIETDSEDGERGGLRDGDVLLGIGGEKMDSLAFERFLSSHSITDPTDPSENFLEFEVLRDGAVETVRYEPSWVGRYRIGIRPIGNRIFGIRSEGRSPGIDLRVDDRVEWIDGRRILSEEEFASAVQDAPLGVSLEVRLSRDGRETAVRWSFPDEAAKERFASSVAVGDDRKSDRIRVIPGEPAEAAGLRDGDRITTVNGTPIEDFLDILEIMSQYENGDVVRVEFLRGEDSGVLEILPRKFFFADPHLLFRRKIETLRVGSITEALGVGFARTVYTAKLVWVMLDRMLFHRTVSTKNIGGILTIGYVSFKFAETGFAKLLYFLALLSINLAILNLLPIPILDGGQLVFLAIEKVKGSPVNEKVMQYAQLVGVALLVLLVIYVTYNDIERLLLNR